jgi:hypothetical protein
MLECWWDCWVHSVKSQGNCFELDNLSEGKCEGEINSVQNCFIAHLFSLENTGRWCSGSCCNVLYVTRMPNQKTRFAYGISMELSGLNILVTGHVCSHSTVIISLMYVVCA